MKIYRIRFSVLLNIYFPGTILTPTRRAISTACWAETFAPFSSRSVSESATAVISQSEKSIPLSGVLKKSAPVKSHPENTGRVKRISAREASLKEQSANSVRSMTPE